MLQLHPLNASVVNTGRAEAELISCTYVRGADNPGKPAVQLFLLLPTDLNLIKRKRCTNTDMV